MIILSFKSGHDGTIAAIEDARLKFSLEAEKDSFPRYDRIHPSVLLSACSNLDELPDVVAVSGWVKGWHSVERPDQTGYYGHDEGLIQTQKMKFFGKQMDYFSSTHERSHLFCAYGMSPFSQGEPCYALVWEGNIGDFYLIDEKVRITKLGHVLTDPGNKYSFLFFLADPSFPLIKGHFRFSDAGKLMALSSFSDRLPMTADEQAITDYLLARDGILLSTPKTDLQWSKFYNIGVESQEFKNLAGKFSDALFDRFHQFAKDNLRKGYPLLISGGCGLNCDWNSQWEESGLFADVFVPPCANDSGSAIGTAIDAQLHYTGNAKIEWDVYAGEYFVEDLRGEVEGFEIEELDYERVARFLQQGNVIGWVQGRYEIGPRALGNRSILAAPFSETMKDRLNTIKNRDGYRPIAPICLETDAAEYFDCRKASPHMLFFHRVKTDKLRAVTHVDQSARAQTVNERQNPEAFRLLTEFKKLTGFGVLCNTSLNFNGRGFINRTSDLVEYSLEHGLDGFVVNRKFYRRK